MTSSILCILALENFVLIANIVNIDRSNEWWAGKSLITDFDLQLLSILQPKYLPNTDTYQLAYQYVTTTLKSQDKAWTISSSTSQIETKAP